MAENRTQDRPMVQMGPRRGGPGGPMVREKPKHMKATLGKLFRYIGKNRYLLIALLVPLGAPTAGRGICTLHCYWI